MRSKMNLRIPADVLYNNISFFNTYRMKFCGQMGTVYVCDHINEHVTLTYGNTVLLVVRPEYAPEIKRGAVFVTDRIIKPEMGQLYDIFKRCRINAGIF